MQRVPIHARLLKYYYASLSCRCIRGKKLLIYCLDVRVCVLILTANEYLLSQKEDNFSGN